MKNDRTNSTKFYSIQQVADFVEVSTRTVRRWIEKGTPRRAQDERTRPHFGGGFPGVFGRP
jgi:hypothetical protein